MRARLSILPVAVEGLGYRAGERLLVREVSFALPRGGLSALVGPNGAGKSLLLRLLCGLLPPSAGRIAWAGPVEGGRRAMVFQKPVMLRRSVRANIAHALAASRALAPPRRTEEALARFGLSPLAGRPARLLSGGEQQRLAIARAWALHPDLLLLDEPTSQLDPGATRQIEDLMAGLVAEGMTLLLATHDLGQARRLASRVLFMTQGRLVEDAPAEAFFDGPPGREAARFLKGDLLW